MANNDDIRTVDLLVPLFDIKVFIEFKGVDVDSGNQLASVHRLLDPGTLCFAFASGRRCRHMKNRNSIDVGTGIETKI